MNYLDKLMVATALKEVLFSLGILELIMIVIIIGLLIKRPLSSLGETIFGSLISGLIIALIIGLAKMDWNIIWDFFRNLFK